MFYQNIRLLITYVVGGHEMTADNITTEFKICSHCSVSKPKSDYYKAKCCKDGLRGECKPCVAAKQVKYNKLNAKTIAKHKKVIYDANTEKNRARNKLYYQENSEVIKVRARKHRCDNYEQTIERQRTYYQKNKELLNSKKRLYRQENKDHVKNIEREWREINKDKVREMKRRYKHKRRSAEGSLTMGIADRLYAIQKGKCVCCGVSIKDGYHMDHIMPLALGGTNTDNNIQLLSPSCNNKKSAKHPIDYMQSKGFLL